MTPRPVPTWAIIVASSLLTVVIVGLGSMVGAMLR